MRISDWSSDVCSSDLDLGKVERVETIILRSRIGHDLDGKRPARIIAASDCVEQVAAVEIGIVTGHATGLRIAEEFQDRKSVVKGKSVSVRVDLGCRRIIKKKKTLAI